MIDGPGLCRRPVVAAIALVGFVAACSSDTQANLERTDAFEIVTRAPERPDWAENLAVPYRGPLVLVDGCLYYEGRTVDGGVNQIAVFPDGSHPATDAAGNEGVALPDGAFIELDVEYDVEVAYSALIDQFELDPDVTPRPTTDDTRSTLGLFVTGISAIEGD